VSVTLFDPKTGQLYDAPDEEGAEAQIRAYGLERATPEQVAEYDAIKAQQAQPIAGRARAAGTAALATGARLIEGTAGAIEGATGFGTAPGLEAEQGSLTTAEAVAPSAFTPEARAARQAFPGSATAGALAPAVGLGVALAPVSGGASGLIATEGIIGGLVGEASSAALEERQMSARGALINGVIGVGLGGLGAGAGAALRSLQGAKRPLVETAEQVVNRRVPRALLEAGEDLADPETAARATEISRQRIDSLVRRIDEAATSARPPVANNPAAQQQALTGLADELAEAQPELAAQLREMAELPRGMRWRELQSLESSNPDVAAALDGLRNDAALWGERAVAHGQALAAARAARSAGPGEFRTALQGIEDTGVRQLVTELDSALDDAAAIEAAQAFAPARRTGSVGAAAEDFTDTDFETAIKEIDEGKLKGRALQAVADVAPGKRALMSLDAGDSLDTIDEILKQDVSFGVKVADFESGAREFTPEIIEAQRGWISDQAKRGREIADLIADARTKVETGQGFDTKGLGVEAINTIRTGLSRIEAATDAATRNIETDLLKREVDSLVKRVGGSRSLDEGTQRWLMQRLRPYADSLREGLQDTSLWGRNARLQTALNAGWHKLIEPYSRVQRQLSEMLGREYGEIGAAAINRRANVPAIERAMASDKGRGFYRDMVQALEGLDDIAEARQSFGLSRLERLDEMRAAIANVRDQFNAATVLRIAEKRAGVPAKLSTGELVADTALDAAGMIPGVGLLATGARVARKAAQRLQPDLELTEALRGTATGRIFARNLRRFSRTQLEQLQDVGFTREMLPPSLRGALRRYGAPSSVGGLRPSEAREILVRKAARGSRGGRGGQGTPPPVDGAPAVAGAAPVPGQVGLDPVGPKQPLDSVSAGGVPVGSAGEAAAAAPAPAIPDDVLTPHVGSVAGGGILAERLSGPGGKTPGGFFRGSDGVVRYVKVDKDATHSAVEAGNAQMYAALGRKVPDMRAVELPDGKLAIASEAFGPEWKELDQIEDWSQLPQSVRDSYAAGVPIDFIMGNWDVSRNARNIMTNGVETLMVDPGEAAANAWAAKWFAGNERHVERELARTAAAGKGQLPSTDEGYLLDPNWGAFVGKEPSHSLLRSYATSEGEMRAIMQRSFDDAVAKIEQAGGPEAFIRHHQPKLDDAAVKRAAEEMADRIRRFKAALPALAGIVAVAFASEASAAAPEDMQAADMLEAESQRDLEATARALTDPAFAERWARQARELPGTLERFQGPHATLRQAFAERRQAILDATRDPETLIGVMADRFGDLPPEVGMQALQVAQYLSKELPPVRGATVTRPNGLPPDELEMRAWALKYETAVDPSSAFDDAKRGKLRHEQVRTLKAVWPDRYEELRTATLMAMGEGRSSVTQRMRADLLFGFAESLDPAFSRRLSTAAAQAYAERDGAGAPSSAPASPRSAAAANPGGLNALQLGASAPLTQ
jgi:hypothetical protein